MLLSKNTISDPEFWRGKTDCIDLGKAGMNMLELIDLDIDSLGYAKFISAWLYRGSNGVFLVDPGPAATIGHLVAEIRSRGIENIDWVLLTHIHMDHSGGIGHLLKHFRDAKVVCHEKAVDHLVDPGRLLEGSRKVLGKVAAAYGEILPIDRGRIVVENQIGFEDGIAVVPTPGHAPHHQCYVFRDMLFCGEMFGVHQPLENAFYLRPATPPRFVLDDFLESMEKIRPYIDRKICFGHYGSHPDGLEILEMSKNQLMLWVDMVRSCVDRSDRDGIIARLLKQDTLFARISFLSGLQYKREIYFAGNSIRGISSYFDEKTR